MTSKLVLLTTALVGFIAYSQGYPSGAPQETCKLLTANHEGQKAKTGRHNYNIKISPAALSSGSKATVTIDGDVFKGFFIQAIDAKTKKPVGSFKPKAGVSQTRDCSGPGSATAATHVDHKDKSSVNFEWQAPASFKGEIYMKAIIVKTYENFWDDVRSKPVTIA